MHTRTCFAGTTFFFNGDLSGNIYISGFHKNGNDSILIPAKDIIELIARELILPKMQDKLEDKDNTFLINHLLENLP